VEQQKQLAAEAGEAAKTTSSKLPTPGKTFAWD